MTRWYNDLLRIDADNAGMDKPCSKVQFRGSNEGLIKAADREIKLLNERIAARELAEYLDEIYRKGVGDE